jgi:dTDP-4-dehydrorhamnose 3,5-epimerase
MSEEIVECKCKNNKRTLFPTFEDFRGSFTPLKLSSKPEHVKEWDQINVSVNKKRGTFRGMHYQSVNPQQKYIKVVTGSIIDYLYHLETKHVLSFQLNNEREIFVPKDYAHGFLTLEDDTTVVYLTEGKYDPQNEHSIPFTNLLHIKDNVLRYFKQEEIIITEKDLLGK